MTTDSFSAEKHSNGDVWARANGFSCLRRVNGDVWIISQIKNDPFLKYDSFLKDGAIIKIPKEHCADLAKILLPELGGYIHNRVAELIKQQEKPDYKVDYS